jgi:polysaccharide biosynthesis protein PslH
MRSRSARIDSAARAAQNRRMRVLYVTPRFPGVGLRGDQMRSFEQIRHLASRHRISLIAGAAPEPALREHVGQHDWCESIRVLPPRWPAQLAGVCAALGDGRPLQTGLYDRWLPDALRQRLRGEGFDLVHLQMARLAGLLPQLAPLPCVVDLVDALSLNMARRAEFDRGLAARLAAFEAPRLARLEQQLCRSAAGIAISAADDRSALPAEAPVQTVANGVDPQRFPFVDGRHGSAIVFAGNLGYFPNVDGACWFAEQVLPRIRAQAPGCTFRLVGATPSPRLQRLARSTPGVHLVGPVADMHAALCDAAIAVCPLRGGSGQQLKLLEAMASGTPLVALRRPASSLGDPAALPLRVADAAEDMAAAVLALLADGAAAATLAREAQQWVRANFTWAQAATDLDALWHRAAGSG